MDWAVEGYDPTVDRELLRKCCDWRRDFVCGVFKVWIESGFHGEEGKMYFQSYIDKVEKGNVEFYEALRIKK